MPDARVCLMYAWLESIVRLEVEPICERQERLAVAQLQQIARQRNEGRRG